MCSRLVGVYRRVRDCRGQTTSEYVVLTGLATGIAILVATVLGLSIRQAFFQAAQRMLSVITGTS